MPMKRNAREYKTWYAMHRRCYNPKERQFHNYGGRGIRVCRRWHKFHNFLIDMGARPLGCTLDRENNNGDYTPKNCRWATAKQQQRNKRTNRPLTFQGITVTQVEWAEITGLSTVTIHHRLRRGWSVEDTLSVPAHKERSMVRFWIRSCEARTHCKRGHELTPENIYDRGPYSKECRKCALIRAIAHRERVRAASGWNGQRRPRQNAEPRTGESGISLRELGYWKGI